MVDFSPLKDFRGTADFFLLRHGQSEGNKQDIVQGHLDYPLSGEGREQASRTGIWLAGRNIQSVFCSPLKRAAETARIAAQAAGLAPPVSLPQLLEMDTGIYTGLALADAAAKYPELWPRFQAESWEAVEGTEKIPALKQRATAAWETLVQKAAAIARGEAPAPPSRFGLLAVTHAGFFQWLIRAASGGDSWFPLFPMGHCGVYQLSLTGTVSRWELLNFQAPGVTGKR
ncbi:MAG: histidine phosphatase family protein [Spirochaetia bacterium]|jgi:probable phosphoglycerate mutase|nr:histidine phosphatase family protein [Spirochaetia bacterium]